MRKIGMALVLLCGLIGSAQAKPQEDRAYDFAAVTTADGPVLGSRENGVNRFLGIPYAETADWRFALDAAAAGRKMDGHA